MKNTRGGVLLLITLQASACNFTKSNICSMGVFSSFLNCTIGTKLRKASVCYSIVTRIQILITVACIFCCTSNGRPKKVWKRRRPKSFRKFHTSVQTEVP